MRKRTRTSQPIRQMVDGVPVLISRRGHINECCFCGAKHKHQYEDDQNGGLWWTTKLVRRGRLGHKP